MAAVRHDKSSVELRDAGDGLRSSFSLCLELLLHRGIKGSAALAIEQKDQRCEMRR